MSLFIYFYVESGYAECRYTECHYAECRIAECHFLFIVMLSVVVPSRSNPLNETHYFKIILDFKITEITL